MPIRKNLTPTPVPSALGETHRILEVQLKCCVKVPCGLHLGVNRPQILHRGGDMRGVPDLLNHTLSVSRNEPPLRGAYLGWLP